MARTFAMASVGVVGFLLLLELLFRLLPVSSSTETGYHFDPKILTYPAHHEWRVATGWDLRNAQSLRSNNFGFVADHDFVRDEQAIALVGDSYVEASMLRAPDRLGAQLERALGGRRPVYAMGSPGTALLDYAERIRFAHQRFGVRDFVVLMERGDVRQSLCGSGNVHSECLDPKTLAERTEKLPPPSRLKQVLRHSSVAQYVFSQLKVEPARLWKQAFAGAAPPSASARIRTRSSTAETADASLQVVDTVTRVFLARVQPHVPGRLVIVLDSWRGRAGSATAAEKRERQRFIELVQAAGVQVVDTEPLYRDHFAASSLSLDVGPYDGHLNALGLQIIARAAAKAFE